jgi:hypothetical protein
MAKFVQQVLLLLHIKYDDELDLMEHRMDHMYKHQLLELLNHRHLFKKRSYDKVQIENFSSYHNPKYVHHIQNKHHSNLQLLNINS